MAQQLIGRKEELARLEAAYQSDKAEFVIVYGRRRVGKTFLIRSAFADKFDFCVTGLFRKSKKKQLENFSNALAEWSGMEREMPKDWYEAFRQLKEYLKTLGDRRKLVFIDEMPWMSTAKSDFVGALENFWNAWGSGESNLKMIVCGSASSWFSNNVFSNKGGLFNRDTERICLNAFTLAETEEYIRSQNIEINRYEIAECYMIMGGIPYYLSKLQKGLSMSQNIDLLFFRRKALLWDEFTHLYDALFNQSEVYVKVVEALATKRGGMTQKEILDSIGVQQGGNFSKVLDNLEFSDIIAKYISFGGKQKEEKYVLTDFYTLFYFKYIKDNNSHDEAYWTNRLDDPGHNAWRGLSFEMLCRQHTKQIKAKLGISGVATEIYTFSSKSHGKTKGAQIDLIIDRRDQVINICEMKFTTSPYRITKTYQQTLQNKLDAFRQWSSSKKALHLTMVTSYGLKQSEYNDIVQNVITLDDLFEK